MLDSAGLFCSFSIDLEKLSKVLLLQRHVGSMKQRYRGLLLHSFKIFNEGSNAERGVTR